MNRQKALTMVGFPMVIIFICLGLKWRHIQSNNQDLLFILGPVNFLVSMLTHSQGFFDPEIGFYHQKLSVVIDKSCAGFNFLIIAFGSFFSLLYSSKAGIKTNILNIFKAIIISYCATCLANCSRIIVSIKTVSFSDTFSWLSTDWFHEAIGSFIYLGSLITIYLILQNFLIKNNSTNAKLT